MSPDLKKRLALLAAIVGVLLAVYLLWPSEAKKVERAVRGAADAFASENLIGLAGSLARDYADAQGRGYEEVLGAAKAIFDGYEGIQINFVRLDVTLDGTRAQAAATVHVAGDDGKGHGLQAFFGDRDTFDVQIGLRKGTDGWRITSVDERLD